MPVPTAGDSLDGDNPENTLDGDNRLCPKLGHPPHRQLGFGVPSCQPHKPQPHPGWGDTEGTPWPPHPAEGTQGWICPFLLQVGSEAMAMLLEPGMQSLRMGKDVPREWHWLRCPLTTPDDHSEAGLSPPRVPSAAPVPGAVGRDLILHPKPDPSSQT